MERETMDLLIKQELQESPEVITGMTKTADTTVSPVQAVQSRPEYTAASQEPASECVTTSAQFDVSSLTESVSFMRPMTSAPIYVPPTLLATSSLQTTSSLLTTPSFATLSMALTTQNPKEHVLLTDKPRNFKLQIDQHGGLRLAPPTSASEAPVESRQGTSSGDPVFFIDRTADGANQLFTSFSKEPGKLYILRPSGGQELSVKVGSSVKPAPKHMAPNVRSVVQSAQTCSQDTRISAQRAAARSVLFSPNKLYAFSLPQGQVKTSLLQTAKKHKADFSKTQLKTQLNTKPDAACSKESVSRIATSSALKRPLLGLPFISGCSSRSKSDPVQREKRKRKQTARKSLVQHTAAKLTSGLKSDVIGSSLSQNAVISSTSTMNEDDGCEDVNNCQLKIDSVFSLADCEGLPSDIAWEEEELRVDEKKAIKEEAKTIKPENNCQSSVPTRDELENMCGSCFTVLESLDKTLIEKREYPISPSKCSAHCRKRTLDYLCMLDLIVCHDKKKRCREHVGEMDTFCRKMTISKGGPLPSADNSALLSDFEQNDFTNQRSFPELSVSTAESSSAVFQMEVVDKSVDSQGKGTAHLLPCTTASASSVTTDGRLSLKTILAESLLKLPIPSVTPAYPTSIPCVVTSHESVTPSSNAVSFLSNISKSSKKTLKDSTLEQEVHVTGVGVVSRENSQNSGSSSASAMASCRNVESPSTGYAQSQIVCTTSCQSSDVSSPVLGTANASDTACASITQSNPALTISAKPDNEPSSKQVPNLSSAVPVMVTALPLSRANTSTVQTATTKQSTLAASQSMQYILTLMTAENSTNSTQNVSPMTYAIARIENGSSLTPSVGQVPDPSCTKGVTSTTNTAIVSSTSNLSWPVMILPKRSGAERTSLLPSPNPSNPMLNQVPKCVTVPSQPVTTGTSLPANIHTVYVFPDGTVIPLSACKLESASALKTGGVGASSGKVLTVISPATSTMQSATVSSSSQPVCDQPKKVSLVKSGDTFSSPLSIRTANAMTLKPAGQTVSTVPRPQSQRSKMVSVSGNATHSSPVTVIVNKAASVRASRPVSSRAETKDVVLRPPSSTASFPSGMLVSSLLKKPQSFCDQRVRKPTDGQVIQPSRISTESTIKSQKSIDVTSSTETQTGTSSAVQQLCKSSTRLIKIGPASSVKTSQGAPASIVMIGSPSSTKTASRIDAKVTEPVTAIRPIPTRQLSSATCTNTELSGNVILSAPVRDSIAAERKQPYLKIFTTGSSAATLSNATVLTYKENDNKTSQSSMSTPYANSVGLSAQQSMVIPRSENCATDECSSKSVPTKITDTESECRQNKRDRFEKKYPVPPGVRIKTEPVTFGFSADTTTMYSDHSSPGHDDAVSDLSSASLAQSALESSARDFTQLHPSNPESTSSVSTTDTTSQPSDLSSSSFAELDCTDTPVGFQLCDPDTDSDSENPPADLDCAQLDLSIPQSATVVFEEPPVLTPMVDLQSYPAKTDSSLESNTENASFSGQVSGEYIPVSSSPRSEFHSCTRQLKTARKTTSSTNRLLPKSKKAKKSGSTICEEPISFSDDDDLETSSASASRGLLSPPLTSSLVTHTSDSSLSEVDAVSSGSAFDRIRRLKEKLKQQNEQLEQMRLQRAQQSPFVLTDD